MMLLNGWICLCSTTKSITLALGLCPGIVFISKPKVTKRSVSTSLLPDDWPKNLDYRWIFFAHACLLVLA